MPELPLTPPGLRKEVPARDIQPVNLKRRCGKSYLEYRLSVIIGERCRRARWIEAGAPAPFGTHAAMGRASQPAHAQVRQNRRRSEWASYHPHGNTGGVRRAGAAGPALDHALKKFRWWRQGTSDRGWRSLRRLTAITDARLTRVATSRLLEDFLGQGNRRLPAPNLTAANPEPDVPSSRHS